MKSVVVIDDHKIVREGFSSMISDLEGFDLIAQFSTGQPAKSFLQANRVDVVICDISLPDVSGLELMEQVLKSNPEVNFLLFTMHDDRQYVLSGIEKGARGIILKDSEHEDLMEAIKAVSNGQMFYDRRVSNILAQKFRQPETGINVDLTDREREVLKLIVEGFTTKEIADKVYLSSRTVDAHRRRVMQKVGARNTADLVRIAMSDQLVQ